jgi:hypothetical protein
VNAPELATGKPFQFGLAGLARVLKRAKNSADPILARICTLSSSWRALIRFGIKVARICTL